MALTKRQKQNTIRDVKLHDDDTGSAESQIALLSRRIGVLTGHLKKNKKDQHSRQGLLKIVAKRRKHMKYLQTKSKKRYNAVAKKLDLKAVK